MRNRNEKRERHRIKRAKKKLRAKGNFLPILDSSIRLGAPPEFRNVSAPQNLNLGFEFVEETLAFIKEIKDLGESDKFLHIDLKAVRNIEEGAIAMLLSVLLDLYRGGVRFTGIKPDLKVARDILERSGIFDYLNGKVAKENVTKNRILTTGENETHPDVLIPGIFSAMDTIWTKEGRCPPLFGGIAEMLRNSCDHAFQTEKQIVWHLGISHFEAENYCKFSFVDNGKGIISTSQKHEGWNLIWNFFKSDAKFLVEAYQDGIESSTGLPWRGKGLPTIFELYQENIIKNLIVITNSVYLDFEKGLFKTLDTSFSGTYYFWKIDRTCRELVYFP